MMWITCIKIFHSFEVKQYLPPTGRLSYLVCGILLKKGLDRTQVFHILNIYFYIVYMKYGFSTSLSFKMIVSP